MELELRRDDLRQMRWHRGPLDPVDPGCARLEVEAFGLTSNNITYAVFGEAMQYWDFFPAAGPEAGAWGRLPVWGFATVAESRAADVPEGTRLFGYLPLGRSLVVQPVRIDPTGFSDGVEHRQGLPGVYNRYAQVEADPLHRADREAQQMLLWPLFVTSFVIDDFLDDHQLFGAATVVVSSASAKTSLGAAFLLAERPGVEVVGLTSPDNVAFARQVGCYHDVLTYDQVSALPAVPTVYVDVAGRRDVQAAVHTHLGDSLRHSMVVGDTHWESTAAPTGPLPGPRPRFLFAPDQIAKRRRDWGRDGFEAKVGTAWQRFITWTDRWLVVEQVEGPDAVQATVADLLDGRIDPRVGHVCRLGAPR